MKLIDQRCANHALREAAVQCPSCKRFFCRECVTEHQGRMVCGICVSVRNAARPAARFRFRWTLFAAGGIVLAWLLFYYLGLMLTRIPAEFHAEPEARIENSGADRSRWSRLQRVDPEMEPPAGAVNTRLFIQATAFGACDICRYGATCT